MRIPALVVLSIATLAQAQTAVVLPQPLTVEGAVPRVYKSIDGTELRLHLFNPPNHTASMRRAAIVLFFGGGWNSGSVRQLAPQARHLSARGMVAIVADYRVFGRHKTSPFEAITDAKSSIRWVRSHAKEHGIDPDRIAAGGGSAGGHIALSAAVFDGFEESSENRSISSKPNALVLFNPAVDTSQVARFGERGREGSPLHHLARNLPPMLVLHGKADMTVPYSSVEKLCEEARKLGNRCELVGYDGAAHGFFNAGAGDGTWHRETLMEADRFLTSLGYLK